MGGATLTNNLSAFPSMDLYFIAKNISESKPLFVRWLSSNTNITALTQDGVRIAIDNILGTPENPFITKKEITQSSKFQLSLENESKRTEIPIDKTATKNLYSFRAHSKAGTYKYYYLLYEPEVPPIPITLNSVIYKGIKIDITTNHEPAEFSFLTQLNFHF